MRDINNTVIVHPQEGDDSVIVILNPSPDRGLTVEEIALKDTPAGVPFKYLTHADVPTDWTFRNAWEVDFSAPDGVGVGHAKWFADRGVKI